jgi:hypothetical protein
MLDLLLIEWVVTKMKLGSNSVEFHPQLSHNRRPVDSALVGAGSLWRVLESVTDIDRLLTQVYTHLSDKGEKFKSILVFTQSLGSQTF